MNELGNGIGGVDGLMHLVGLGLRKLTSAVS